MLFMLFAFVLIILALLFVVPGLIKKHDGGHHDHQKANIEATRQQLEVIGQDVENDLVQADQLQAIREETEALLAVELQQQAQQSPGKDRSATFYSLSTVIIVLAVPVLAFLIYAAVGQPAALFGVQQPAAMNQHNEADQNLPSIDEMIVKLEQRLKSNPDDLEGWFMLARTSMITQRFDQAVVAMEKVYALSGDNADVLARYADAVVMANGGSFNQQANQLIEKALELEPNHVQAMWLAGMSALKSLNYEQAIDYFERSKSIITDPQSIAELDRLIATAARERAGLVEQPESSPQTEAENSTTVQSKIKVTVALAADLRAKTSGDDSLFVFAKAASGPPMPLTVSKHKVSELPIEVELNDSMAMMPALKLSAFDQVIISARISKTGEPTAQSGDLQGQSGSINPQQTDTVNITIDQIVK